MKKQFAVVLLALSGILMSLGSCTKVNGRGPVISETRNVSNFDRIDFETSGRLYFRQAPTPRIEIRAQRNILEVIESRVRDGELKIKIENNTIIHSHAPIEVYVEGPALREMEVDGSGDVYISDPLDTDELKVEVSGSGKIDIVDLNAPRFEARIAGSGDIIVRNGEGDRGKLRVSGSGDINMVNFRTRIMETETSGSGDMRVWVTDELDAKISGSGSVIYKGAPQVKLKVSGSGSVRPY
ncbi:MAG TPA: head GIN domain-containing protein [Flavihumibacter sp.]|jgi:hypothetical protein